MATNRSLVFAVGETYHIFNRGVDRRPLFLHKKEYDRFMELMQYYKHTPVPFRYSDFRALPEQARELHWDIMTKRGTYEVSILAYCLMPNHFHLVLKEVQERGIFRFLSNISNGYAKYFNTKHQRVGPLFQGAFKAVHIESDEQLLHITRYVHLNPLTAFMISENELDTYPWSSLHHFIGEASVAYCDTAWVKEFFKQSEGYHQFVHDQIDYAKTLAKIKHLSFEDKDRE